MIVSPLRNQLARSIIMLPRNNFSKLFPRSVASDLLTPTGGAGSHAYFQFQHLHLHPQRNVHCSCPLSNNGHGKTDTSPKSTSTTNNLDPGTKAKLDALKQKLSLSQNEFYLKYEEKFKQLELTSPRELLAKLEALDARVNPPVPKSKHGVSGGVQKQIRPKNHFLLNDVMEIDKIKDLERDDIIYVWQEFHRKKEGLLAAVMSEKVYEKLEDTASHHPMFIMPLPREHGYEFLFVQYMDKAFHFTPLLAYQTHQENSPECLRLISYTDLQSSKDLVLMRGEFDKNLLTAKDAHILAVQINFYFGETSESRTQLLENFTSRPELFQHMDLINEFKKLQESHPHLFEIEQPSV